jgi:hypothetical protein
MDQNAMLAELLRRRNAASKQAELSAGNAQQYGSMFQNPQFQQTIRGSNGNPDMVQANWGDILGKGISNYMGAKERKQAIDSKQQVNEINNEFMQTTLRDDPQATKLYGAVQAGVPGAGQALSAHLAPKKQAMAVAVQAITSGMLDPEMAYQMAPQYGLDPNVMRKAAEYAATKKQEAENSKFADKSAIENQKIEGKQALQSSKPTASGYTPAELAAMPIEQRLAAVQAASGRETAESKLRGKAKINAEQQLPKTQYALDNINRVIGLAEKADYWPGNLGLKANKVTTNPNNVNLRQALYQLTLDANNGSLGTGFSNADRDFLLGAQADIESGNVKTVTSQLRNLIVRLKQKQESFQREAAGGKTPMPSTSSNAAPSGPAFDDMFPAGTFPGE